MKWHLNFRPERPGFRITHKDSLFFIGSCFSSHMASRLHSGGFTVHKNPAGTLFNPFSIAQELEDFIQNRKPQPTLVLQRDHRFVSFQAHSEVSADNEEDLLLSWKERQQSARKHLKSANFLFITIGTAFYYHHIKLNTVVANCHKENANFFEKKMATPEEIVSRFAALSAALSEFNPQLKIILTLSPVRHLKDGIAENSLSKSILRYAMHVLCGKESPFTYFPAFELINDDLKDYRFYKEDLAHPNEMAISYVWSKFKETYFEAATGRLADLYEDRSKALAHRSQDDLKRDSKLAIHLKKLEDEIKRLENAGSLP
jgi:hypothetical protein